MADRSITIRLLLDSKQYEAGMNAAAEASKKVGAKAGDSAGRAELLGSALTKVGALAAAGIGLAIKSFAEFDASMSAVQANTGASGAALDSLRQAAINAGKDTIYNAKEAADAIKELAKAGMSTQDVLSGGLSGALNLAASDGMEVADAAELMASTLAQFNLQGKDAGSVADALAAGAGKAQGSARDLGYALQQSGMVANSFGISMTETVGTLASFANAGMTGSDAGTSLKSMLIALANPSTKAAETMKQLGINAYDSQGKFVGLAGLAGQLKTKMAGLTDEQRNAALATIFGSDAIRAANVLYKEGSKGIANWTKEVSQSGFAAEQAQARTNNLKGDLEQLLGSLETVGINLGSGMNGPLRTTVQTIESLVDAFGSLPQPVQQSILLLTAAAGGVAALHKIMTPMAKSASAFSNSMALMVDPVNRVTTALPSFATALTQMGAAFGSPIRQSEVFGSTVTRSQGVLNGLGSAGQGVVSLLGGPWGAAFTVGALVVADFAQRQADAKARVDALSQALQNGQTAAEYYAKALSESSTSAYTSDWFSQQTYGYSSVSEALDKVGISHSTYAKAIQGDAAAVKKVREQADQYRNSLGLMGQMFDRTSEVGYGMLAEQQEVYRKSTEASKEDAASQAEAAKQKVANTLATAGLASATQDAANATQDAADSQTILEDGLGATTDGINAQASALAEVIDALSTYYGFSTSASDATISLHDAFDKADASAQKYGQTLDLNTEAGRANQSALNDVAESALKAAEAQAKNGASTDEVNATLDEARNRYIRAAEAMGMTPEAAAAAADAAGLTRDQFDRLAQAVNGVPDNKTVTVQTQVEDADNKIRDLGLTVATLPNGEIKISGDNTDALNAISLVNGVQIDPKTGILTLDKNQYDVALALANGASIDEKTGYLKCNNSEFWQKFAETQGWHISDKTGVISGDNVPFMAAKKAVDDTTIAGKTVQVGANASGFWSTINSILGSVFHDNVCVGGKGASAGLFSHGLFNPGYASGGPVVSGLMRGPGTGTSDSIVLRNARVADGEYVQRAKAVEYYGVDAMNAINNLSIPRSLFDTGYSPDAASAPKYTANTRMLPANTGGPSAGEITEAVKAALSSIPGFSLRLNNEILAGEIAPAMDRALADRQTRGL